MEQNDCPKIPVDTIPFKNKNIWRANKINNQCIKNTLRIWSNVRLKFKLTMSTSRAMMIANNTNFPPSKLEAGFKKWQEKAPIMLGQLFERRVLMSFEQLQHKHNLSTHDFFKYLQLRHYLQTHQEWDKLCTPPSNIEHFFTLTIQGTITEKIISHIYKILQDNPMDNSLD